jgi:hypothetical protein
MFVAGSHNRAEDRAKRAFDAAEFVLGVGW